MSFWIGLIFGAVAGAGVALIVMPRSSVPERDEGNEKSIELIDISERPAAPASPDGGDPPVKGGIYVRRES